MLQLVAQLVALFVAFLVAVIGAFFKCVKEDSHGRPVYSSRGVPALTTPGKYILTLLAASFVVSAGLSWSSSKDMDNLGSNLREARKDEANLSAQLASANSEIQRRQEDARIDSARRLNDVTQKLEGASLLLDRRVREVSQVRSFFLLMFFYDMNRPEHIPGRRGLSGNPDSALVPSDSPGIFRDLLCGANVKFDIVISPRPRITFHAVCVDDVHVEIAGLPVKVVGESWYETERGMVVSFAVGEQLARFGPELNMNSFSSDRSRSAWAIFSGWFHKNVITDEDYKRLEPFLPKHVGFAVAPNGDWYDPKSIWIYGPPERATSGLTAAIRYRHGTQGHLWPGLTSFGFLGMNPTDIPFVFFKDANRMQKNLSHFPLDLSAAAGQKQAP